MSRDFTNFEDDEDGGSDPLPPRPDGTIPHRPDAARIARQQLGVRIHTPFHDPGHANPPLTALNSSYRKSEEEERLERNSVLEKAMDGLKGAFGRDGKRGRKPLRPVP